VLFAIVAFVLHARHILAAHQQSLGAATSAVQTLQDRC
jgi:hypothetical protein